MAQRLTATRLGEREVGLAFAPVRQAGEELGDEGEFGGRLRAFGGMGGSHGAQGFGQVASAQDGAGAGLEFAHPELFGPVVRELEILADTAVALGALPLN